MESEFRLPATVDPSSNNATFAVLSSFKNASFLNVLCQTATATLRVGRVSLRRPLGTLIWGRRKYNIARQLGAMKK